MDGGPAASSTELVEDLFRKEYAHLVSALTRVLGPSNIPLAEDVVHDALVSAMHAWRFGLPQDPKAWIIRAAHNRAIDVIRREQRHRSLLPELATTTALAGTIDAGLAPGAESVSQLAMMFAVCDPGLNGETHVTLILRWVCGLSPKEIGQAFLVDTQTIDRRLHRGRGRLRQLGRLPDVDDLPDIDTRRDSVLRSLYLLFNEGYHGSSPAARSGTGDPPEAAIRDRRRDGRRDHRGTLRLSRRTARSRSFRPLAGSGAGRRRSGRRCRTDRADALSEFGLDSGQHGIAVPRRTSTPTLNPPGQSARCAGLRHSWVAHGGRR